MRIFFSLSDQQPSDTDEFRIMENSKRCRTAKPFREKSQRLGIFSFECAAECFWAASKPFQSNVSIQGGIGWRIASYLNLSGIHIPLVTETSN
jgi:hypothetical protein